MTPTGPQENGAALAESVADPKRYPLDEAVARCKAAMEDGSMPPRELAALLREEIERPDGGRVPRVRRLLEILSLTGRDQDVVECRGLLMSSRDERIRSKATLMIGRATRNPAWVAHRLLDPDTRVQANAIQSLWGMQGPEVRETMVSMLNSPHPRVVANCLVGLYRMNDAGSIPRLLAMAASPHERFRISARWAMGETGDPRFIPFLMKAFQTDDAKGRSMVIRSLTRLRRRVKSLEETRHLNLRVVDARLLPGGSRGVIFSILRGPNDPYCELAPLDIVVTEDSRLITDYELTPLPEPDRLVTAASLPRILSQDDPYRLAAEQALARCLEVKPAQDLWFLDRYLSGQQLGKEPALPLAATHEDPHMVLHLRQNRGLLADPEMIRRIIPGPGAREKASRDMTAGLRVLVEATSRVSGSRHAMVFFDPEQKILAGDCETIQNEARDLGLAIHILTPVALEDAPRYKAFCEATGGVYRQIDLATIVEEFPRMYQGMRNRYQIAYNCEQPPVDGQTAEIGVYSPCGSGSVAVQFSPVGG